MSSHKIVGVRVFDGERLLDGAQDVTVVDGLIGAVEPSRAEARSLDDVDGFGALLLPGLIDAHVHASLFGLQQAALFGVTTVLDMGSSPGVIDPLRLAVAERADLADLRSAVTGLTRPDGHPHQMIGDLGHPDTPTVSTVAEVPSFVADRVAEGADYLKTWVEDGEVLGSSVPPLQPTILRAYVEAGHAAGRHVLVHAMKRRAAEQAVAAGADGLTHLFVDEPLDDGLLERFVVAEMHVVPTLSLLASIAGDPAAAPLADEPRVRATTPSARRKGLQSTLGTLTPAHLETALAAVKELHEAGVLLFAGTDTADFAMPGLAPGVSLHGELRLLVRAGLSPAEALRAATCDPADRFGLTDRGRIRPGLRADLLLVEGDPTIRIEESLAIREVWRGGSRVEPKHFEEDPQLATSK